MHLDTPGIRLRASRVTVLSSALVLAALQLPAFAGVVCLNSGSAVVTGSANGLGAFSCGYSGADGLGSSAFGSNNSASGRLSSAFGYGNVASGAESSAFGLGSTASGLNGSAFGRSSHAGGAYSTAMGFFASTSGTAAGALAIGGWYDLNGNDNPFETEENANATGVGSVAVGAAVTAAGTASAAFGVNAIADAGYSVAIGYGAVADREYTISVGSAARMNQIANLADGTEDTDAVNLRQMRAADDALGGGIAAWLGGGAAHAGGVFTAPVYVIQSGNYDNVGSAFTAVDTALTDINARMADAGGIQGERGYSAYEVAVQNGYAGNEADWLASLAGPQGPTGPEGPEGPEGPAGGGPRVVSYDSDDRDTLTLAGASGTTISNVADGVAGMDAVNLRQMQAGDAATLQSAQDYADAGDAATLQGANAYTDTVAVQTLESANAYTDGRFAAWDAQLESIQRGIDDRFHRQDRRIDRQGSMAGAFAGMAMNTAGLAGRNRVGVGVGAQGGERALAVGYQRAIGNRASVSLGGAFSGSEKSMMGGAGFSW